MRSMTFVISQAQPVARRPSSLAQTMPNSESRSRHSANIVR